MRKLTLLFSLVFSTQVFAATGGVMRYTPDGLPDFSGFVVGTTTLGDVQAAMGHPISIQTDEQGQPRSASFYLPLEGQAAPDAPAVGVAKASFFSSMRSHAGALVNRIPGVGGMAAATAMDASASTTVANQAGQGAKVWSCQVLFQRGRYWQGSCSTINRPIG
jgi:hypothetical protein